MSHVTDSENEISSDSARLLEEIFKETGFSSYASDSNLLRLKCDIDDHHNTVSGLVLRKIIAQSRTYFLFW